METFLLYCILRLNAIAGLVAVFSFLSIVVAIPSCVAFITSYVDDSVMIPKNIGKTAIISAIASIIFSIFLVLLPTTKQAFILCGFSKVMDNKEFITNESKEWYAELKKVVFKKVKEK